MVSSQENAKGQERGFMRRLHGERIGGSLENYIPQEKQE